MSTRIKSVLLTLTVIITVTAVANAKPCDPSKIAGSYIRLGATGDPVFPQVMDQLRLGSDGTAYWYSNLAFQLLTTAGTFIPQVGSWQCTDSNTLVVTTIGAIYERGATDIELTMHVRFTAKLSIIDNDTLEAGPDSRVFRYFALADDPSDPNAVPIQGPFSNTNTTSFRRIKPIASDVP